MSPNGLSRIWPVLAAVGRFCRFLPLWGRFSGFGKKAEESGKPGSGQAGRFAPNRQQVRQLDGTADDDLTLPVAEAPAVKSGSLTGKSGSFTCPILLMNGSSLPVSP